MKVEITIPAEIIAAIAEEVATALRPMIGRVETPGQPRGLLAAGRTEKSGHTVRRDEDRGRQQMLPQVGYLRLKEVLAIIPVSRSTWYKGIADGRYPRPTKEFGPRIAAWDVRDIRPLVEREIS